jgi:hypothetical protein
MLMLLVDAYAIGSIGLFGLVWFGVYATELLLALFFLLNRVLMLPDFYFFENLNITIKTSISTTMEREI